MTTRPHGKRPYRRLMLLIALTLAFSLAACSPEADRSRGDGAASGADMSDPDDSVNIVGDWSRDHRIEYNFPRQP